MGALYRVITQPAHPLANTTSHTQTTPPIQVREDRAIKGSHMQKRDKKWGNILAVYRELGVVPSHFSENFWMYDTAFFGLTRNHAEHVK